MSKHITPSESQLQTPFRLTPVNLLEVSLAQKPRDSLPDYGQISKHEILGSLSSSDNYLGTLWEASIREVLSCFHVI